MSETHKYRDILFWCVSVALVGAGVVLNGVYGDQPLALRLIGWIFLGAVVAGIVLFTTSQGVVFKRFAKEAQNELRKVVWPSRQETIRATGLVLLMVLIVSLLLWGLDHFLFWLVKWLTYAT